MKMYERSKMLYHDARRLARKIIPPKLETIGYDTSLHPLMKVGLEVSVLDHNGDVRVKKKMPNVNTFHWAFVDLFTAY